MIGKRFVIENRGVAVTRRWHPGGAYGVGVISGCRLQPAGAISRALNLRLRAGSY